MYSDVLSQKRFILFVFMIEMLYICGVFRDIIYYYMTESELLLSLSREGVCSAGRRWLSLRSMDFDCLVHVWRRWPEYLYEHYEYAVGLLRSMGDDFRARLAGERLFVDYSGVYELSSCRYPIFLLGDSSIELRFCSFSTVKIYCFGNSSLRVIGDDSCRINVELFGSSRLDVSGGCIPVVWGYDRSSVSGPCDLRPSRYERGDVFNGVDVPDSDESTW